MELGTDNDGGPSLSRRGPGKRGLVAGGIAGCRLSLALGALEENRIRRTSLCIVFHRFGTLGVGIARNLVLITERGSDILTPRKARLIAIIHVHVHATATGCGGQLQGRNATVKGKRQ